MFNLYVLVCGCVSLVVLCLIGFTTCWVWIDCLVFGAFCSCLHWLCDFVCYCFSLFGLLLGVSFTFGLFVFGWVCLAFCDCFIWFC